MLDSLREILAYTQNLGFLELVKVEGTTTSTDLSSIASDQSVVLNSKFNKPVPELEGTFGLHDLGRLNTILNIPEYRTNAFVAITKMDSNGVEVPTGISFQNANRDFRNSYRFMSKEIVESQLPTRTRKAINWDISFTPTQNAIQRLKFQSQAAGSGEGTFSTRVANNNLYFSLGDPSTHSGEFVFASDVKGNLTVSRDWPLSHIQAILGLSGDKVMEISDMGAMQITVTSGLAVHQYTVLSSVK